MPPKKDILTLGNFVTILALLVGVFLVIVVPPLFVKVPLLIAVCFGFLYLIKRSKWTHAWPIRRQFLVWGATVVILCGVAVPQFVSQWREEHRESVLKPAPAGTQTQTYQPQPSPSTQPTAPQPQPSLRIHMFHSQINDNGTAIKSDRPIELDMHDSEMKGNGKAIVNRDPGELPSKKSDCNAAGIHVKGAQGAVVEGNGSHNTACDGVLVENSPNSTVKNNKAYNAGQKPKKD